MKKVLKRITGLDKLEAQAKADAEQAMQVAEEAKKAAQDATEAAERAKEQERDEIEERRPGHRVLRAQHPG